MKLYHITHSANSTSIAAVGLMPAHNRDGLTGPAMFEYEKWRNNVVWLTDDVDYILNYQAGNHFKNDSVVFEVDCTTLEIEHREGYYDNHEWLYYGTVPPELIKVQKPVDISSYA